MFISARLSDYLAQNSIEWAVELPTDTPPSDILYSDGDSDVIYRFSTSSTEIIESDFEPLALKRKEPFEGALFGQSYGLSSFLSEESAKNMMLLPSNRKKFKAIVRIATKSEYGVLKNTPSLNNSEHYTWWHTKQFLEELISVTTFI